MPDQESTPAEGEKSEATESKEGQEPQTTPETPEVKTFDADYVKELRAENAKHRKAAQEVAAKLQEREDADKSELERAQSKIQRAETDKVKAEAELLRLKVAAEKEVPTALHPLLTAVNREDLEAQADLIIENAKPKPTSMDGGVRDNAAAPAQTPEEGHRDFLMNVFGRPPSGSE